MTNKKDRFSEHLQQIRQAKGLSQGDLAKRTGLKPAAISHFETGQRKPSFDNLIKLAEALGVSMDYLFGGDSKHASTASSKLLQDFEKLSLRDQGVVQDMIHILLRKNPNPE